MRSDPEKIDDVRLLFLLNWKERGEWGFYRAIRKRVKEIVVFQPYRFSPSFPSFVNRLSQVLSEFYLPFLAFRKRRHCDVIVSWTMRMGTCYGILNRLFPSSSAAKHVFYDLHINLTRKDPVYKARLKVLRMAIPGADFFLCTSRREEETYSRIFGIPRDRIAFFPVSAPRDYLEDFRFPKRKVIFSYGNSDRDYDTLIQAVKNLEVETVILSQAYTPGIPIPPRVTLIKKKTVGQDLIELIVSSRLVVLPLADGLISAGQTAMLETMALGRPLVVTINPATLEYARHEDSALFFNAGDFRQLEACIRFLLDTPDVAERMGENARKTVLSNLERPLIIFSRVLPSLVRQAR